MDNLQNDISTWAESTFDHKSFGIAAHILSEAAELFFSAGGNTDESRQIIDHALEKARLSEADIPEETADLTILALTMAGYRRFSLQSEVERKMAINRGRTWGKPNSLGFTEHTETVVPDEG